MAKRTRINICRRRAINRVIANSKRNRRTIKAVTPKVIARPLNPVASEDYHCPNCDVVFSCAGNDWKGDAYSKSDSIETTDHRKIAIEFCPKCGFILNQGKLKVEIPDENYY